MKTKRNQNTGGLGRGLDELFDPKHFNEELEQDLIKIVHINTLKAGIHQPRKSFTKETLNELANSIKNQGIIQPLIVRKLTEKNSGDEFLYEIIAGERRFRAAQIAKVNDIPIILRDYSDNETMTIALIENLQREDLNVIEEAEAYNKLKEVHKISQEELAEKLGKSRPAVANALRLLTLPEYIKNSIINNFIKASHGRCLLGISNQEAQKTLFEAIIEQKLNTREIEKAVEEWKEKGIFPNYIIQNKNTILHENEKIEKIKLQRSELIESIDQKLKDKFYKKALIRGDERKGNIKINYKNFEELQYILDTLNIEYKI